MLLLRKWLIIKVMVVMVSTYDEKDPLGSLLYSCLFESPFRRPFCSLFVGGDMAWHHFTEKGLLMNRWKRMAERGLWMSTLIITIKFFFYTHSSYFNFFFQIQLDMMSTLIIMINVWWWYYLTPFGMCGLEFHFTFMIDVDTT